MNTTETVTQTEVITPEPGEVKNGREFHNGSTKFHFRGQKWHFVAPTPDGKTYQYTVKMRGGFEVAHRVAGLFGKDVTKFGRLGGQRANIERLIEAAR